MIEGLGSRRGSVGCWVNKRLSTTNRHHAAGDGSSAVLYLNWYFRRRGFAKDIRPAFLLN